MGKRYSSKMNFEPFLKYLAARKYLEGMQIYTWYKIKSLPWAISYQILYLADEGFSEIRKVVFNETFDCIMIINKADENNLEKSKDEVKPDNSKDRRYGRNVG